MQCRTAEVVTVPEGGTSEVTAVMRMGRGDALAVSRVVEYIAINRLRLDTVHLGAQMSLAKRRRLLERVKTVLCPINVRERIALETLRKSAHTLIGKSHIDQGLLAVIPAEVVHLLALKLVLNPLAIGSVPDQRKNGADPLNEKSSLSGFCVIQCRLHAVVAI